MTHETTLIAVVSDTHAGSTVALCPSEGISLDDGQQLLPSKAQRWLWQNWTDFWEEVDRRRNALQSRLFTLYNGDLIDGPNHHGTAQSMSSHPGTEKAIARACLAVPQALGPEKVFVIRGTESHVGKSGAGEESLAEWLGAERDPDTGAHSWWHLPMEIQDVRMDFAHHGKAGMLPWTKAAAAARYAMQIFVEHAESGEPHPHLSVRSHFHRFFDTGTLAPTRLIQMPAWQLHTAFTRRIATDSLADIGGIMIEIRDGKFQVHTHYTRPGRGSVWKG